MPLKCELPSRCQYNTIHIIQYDLQLTKNTWLNAPVQRFIQITWSTVVRQRHLANNSTRSTDPQPHWPSTALIGSNCPGKLTDGSYTNNRHKTDGKGPLTGGSGRWLASPGTGNGEGGAGRSTKKTAVKEIYEWSVYLFCHLCKERQGVGIV